MADVILLHGWPGLPSDYRLVAARLAQAGMRVLVPPLHGFGDAYEPGTTIATESATADAHAHRILEQAARSGLTRPIVVGYDIGSRIAQAVAHAVAHGEGEDARALGGLAGLVITPAYPGVGTRGYELGMQHVTWYQHFHRNGLASALIDGDPDRVRTYLHHLWAEWSADPTLAAGPEFDATVAAYARPGALAASVAWYTANQTRLDTLPALAVPTVMLWPGLDPIFPTAWADRVGEHFTDIDLRVLERSGHFVPLEAPDAVIAAVRDLAAR